jgi:hypothetical protein
MCYNCGCGLPDEKHGHPDWITNETFEKAKAEGESLEDVKRNVMNSLKKELDKGMDPVQMSNPRLPKNE